MVVHANTDITKVGRVDPAERPVNQGANSNVGASSSLREQVSATVVVFVIFYPP